LLRLQRSLVNISDSRWTQMRQAEMDYDQSDAARQIRVALLFAAPGRSLEDHRLARRYLTSALTRIPILPDSVSDLLLTTRAWLDREIELVEEMEHTNSRIQNLNQQLGTAIDERNALDQSLQQALKSKASDQSQQFAQVQEQAETDIAIVELQSRLQEITRQRDVLIDALTSLRSELAKTQEKLDALTEIEQSVIRPPKKEIP
jgi:chromosome segregation ATPase